LIPCYLFRVICCPAIIPFRSTFVSAFVSLFIPFSIPFRFPFRSPFVSPPVSPFVYNLPQFRDEKDIELLSSDSNKDRIIHHLDPLFGRIPSPSIYLSTSGHQHTLTHNNTHHTPIRLTSTPRPSGTWSFELNTSRYRHKEWIRIRLCATRPYTS
jgi:hypothetical protein